MKITGSWNAATSEDYVRTSSTFLFQLQKDRPPVLPSFRPPGVRSSNWTPQVHTPGVHKFVLGVLGIEKRPRCLRETGPWMYFTCIKECRFFFLYSFCLVWSKRFSIIGLMSGVSLTLQDRRWRYCTCRCCLPWNGKKDEEEACGRRRRVDSRYVFGVCDLITW